MEAQISDVLAIFILCSTAIRHVVNSVWFFASTMLGQKIYKLPLEQVNGYCIIVSYPDPLFTAADVLHHLYVKRGFGKMIASSRSMYA